MNNLVVPNFVIDTTTANPMTQLNESAGCFLYFYLEEGQIQYKLRCEAGRENDMAILLASLHSFELYSAAVDGVGELNNGEDILERHDIAMACIQEAEDEEFGDFDDEEEDPIFSPIVHPLSVYQNSQDSEFGDN